MGRQNPTIEVACTACGHAEAVSASHAARKGRCPTCRSLLAVHAARPAAAARPAGGHSEERAPSGLASRSGDAPSGLESAPGSRAHAAAPAEHPLLRRARARHGSETSVVSLPEREALVRARGFELDSSEATPAPARPRASAPKANPSSSAKGPKPSASAKGPKPSASAKGQKPSASAQGAKPSASASPKPAPPRPAPSASAKSAPSASRAKPAEQDDRASDDRDGLRTPRRAVPAPVSALFGSLPTGEGRARRSRHWVLLLALLPLALFLLRPEKVSWVQRLSAQVRNSPPKVARQVKNLLSSRCFEEIFEVLPEGKIEGAHLARSSKAHWGYAGLSALLFLGLLPLLFPWVSARDRNLLLVLLFTGTFGIGFVHVLASLGLCAPASVDDPESGVVHQMLGYTFGVGLVEELAKALPLILLFWSGRKLSWQRSCLFGLASGVGFGLSEAIAYSGRDYNGLFPVSIYLVRYVSCVGLHAVWSASSAIALSEHRAAIAGERALESSVGPILLGLGAPMIFHGFYDMALTVDYDRVALGTGVASVVWLASEIARAEGNPWSARFAPRARGGVA